MLSSTDGGPTLSLYHSDRCPYCIEVMRELAALGFDADLRNVSRAADHQREVLAATGRRTVPVLRIQRADGQVEWLPESLHIIAYLRGQAPGVRRWPLAFVRVRRAVPALGLAVAAFTSGWLAGAAALVAVLALVERYRVPRRRRTRAR